MRHEPLAGALVELSQRAAPGPGPARVLQPPPEAFDRVEGMAAVSQQALDASLAIVVVAWGGELGSPLAPAALHDHHALCADVAAGRHDWRPILAARLGIKGRHDFVEDLGGASLDSAPPAEQPAPGEPTPRAM